MANVRRSKNIQTHLFVTDIHARPGTDNVSRARWLGNLISDIRPDCVIVGGDTADMPSLCSYDKGKKDFIGRTYQADIEAHGIFQEALWTTVKKGKRKLPRRISLIGNHEQRIDRAIQTQPELEGVVSYRDLQLERQYDTIIPYTGGTPGQVEVDGIIYGHYIVGGVSGRPISGEHHAYGLLTKKFSSCVVGHSHLLDFAIRTRADGRKITSLVGGCYFGDNLEYAGDANKTYWRGVSLLNVEDGSFNPEFISLNTMKREYGTKR